MCQRDLNIVFVFSQNNQYIANFKLKDSVNAVCSLQISSFMGFEYILCCSDIKPENVLIDRTGHVKLVDFGSACRRNAVVGSDTCW